MQKMVDEYNNASFVLGLNVLIFPDNWRVLPLIYPKTPSTTRALAMENAWIDIPARENNIILSLTTQ